MKTLIPSPLALAFIVSSSVAGLGCGSEPGLLPMPGEQSAASGMPHPTAAGGGQAEATAGSLGSAEVAGAALDDSAAAEVLRGYLLEKPCVDGFIPVPGVDQTCAEAPEVETQHRSEQFGGDAGVTYLVTLRVRGIQERHWYEGGTLHSSGRAYVGGLPTAHSPLATSADFTPGQGACPVHPPETDDKFKFPFQLPAEIRPSDDCFNAYTIFALIVSEPKQAYYLNYTDDFDGKDRPAHLVHATDYTVTIAIAGQAALDFYVIDGDHHQVTNDGTLTVEGLNVTQPYNGTVLQLDVVSVIRAP